MNQRVYKPYMVAVLMAILAFNYVDRIALGVVMEDVKTELALTDTQLGLMSGIAFALFYSIMGIPIARWADRGNRVTIISLTTGLWSIAVALCAMAGSFLQLLLIRVGIAVGEAGCIPPAHSLIADTFSRAERPRAVARYMLGAPLSLIIGYFVAGWLNELYGWRVTFMLVGIPGIVLALLARTTLMEPRRAAHVSTDVAVTHAVPGSSGGQSQVAAAGPQPSTREVVMALWSNVTFRHLLLYFSIWYFFGYGLLQWQPTFFIRSHHLQTGELGTWLAVVYGAGGLLGTYLGGEWAARYARNNERLQLRTIAVMFAIFGVFNAASYVAPDHVTAFALLSIGAIGGAVTNGPLFATIQTLVPAHMRAMSLAIIYLFANLIGMGLGPLAAGAASDLLYPILREESLRYALLAFCPGYVWAAWHVWRASRTVSRDIAAAHEYHERYATQGGMPVMPARVEPSSPPKTAVTPGFGSAGV
jgi:MFS family permease